MGSAVEKCYMCDREATSREHVPPRCLFPEKGDVGHSNFRKNLITVPSCDLHNSNKSKEDEFLMVSIAGIVGNNSIGYFHHKGKVTRALRRTSFKLLSNVFIKRKSIRINMNDNKFMDVIVGTTDYERLKRCFIHIAYGVYRYQFHKRFVGEIYIVPGFLFGEDKNPESFKQFVRHKFSLELAEKEPSQTT